MDVILCLDDKNGMLFNGRRQSRDREVTADILKQAEGGRLLISPFSTDLFETEAPILVEPNPLIKGQEGDVCFVENIPLLPYEEKIRKLIVYRWNRVYPSDVKLDILLDNRWKKIETMDFAGYSHEKITKEIYMR